MFLQIINMKNTLLVPLKTPSCKECNIFQNMGGHRKNCKRFEDKENRMAWLVFETIDKDGNVHKQFKYISYIYINGYQG